MKYTIRIPLYPVAVVTLFLFLFLLLGFQELQASPSKVRRPKVLDLVVNNGLPLTLDRKLQLIPTIKGKAHQYQVSRRRNFAGARWKRLRGIISTRIPKRAGVYRIFFRAKNRKTGAISRKKHCTIEKISPPPITIYSLEINKGAEYTRSKIVAVNIELKGLVFEARLSEDLNFTGVPWQPFSPTMSFTLSPGEGRKSIFFQARSLPGTESWVSNAEIILDEDPTVQEATINQGNKVVTSRSISVQVKAEGNPLKMMLSEDSEFSDGFWQPYSSDLNYYLNNLTGMLYIKLQDKYGESAPQKLSYDYDEATQLGHVKIGNGAYTTQPQVSVYFDSEGSPTHYIISESPSFNGATWQPLPVDTQTQNLMTHIVPFTLSDGEGNKRVFVAVKDDHSQSEQRDNSIFYDVPVETHNFRLDSGAANTSTRIVTLQTESSGNPLYYWASEDPKFGDAPEEWPPFSATLHFRLSSSDGAKTVYLKLKDDHSESSISQQQINLQEQETLLIDSPLNASNTPQTFSWKNHLTITLPPLPVDFIGTGLRLQVRNRINLVPHQLASLSPLMLYDISILNSNGEELHDFSKLSEPLVIKFAYLANYLRTDLEADAQLYLSWLDPEDLAWLDQPIEVDELERKIILRTKHLSSWGIHNPLEKYTSYRQGHFSYIFNTEMNVPEGSDPYEYMAIIRSELENAWSSFASDQAGAANPKFKMPDKRIVVNIDEYSPEETVLYGGNIQVPNTYFGAELRHGLAHELFHALQNTYLTRWKMNSRRWYIEACADWAADRIAGKTGYLGKGLKTTFLDFPIDHDPSQLDQHKYQAALFVDEITPTPGAFKDLFDQVMTNSSTDVLGIIDTYVKSKGRSLSGIFASFAQKFIFTERFFSNSENPLGKFVKESKNMPRSLLYTDISFNQPKTTAMLKELIVETETKERSLLISSTSLPADCSLHIYSGTTRDNLIEIGTLTSDQLSKFVDIQIGQNLYLLGINGSLSSTSMSISVRDYRPKLELITPTVISPKENLVLQGQNFGTQKGFVLFFGPKGEHQATPTSWTETEIKVNVPELQLSTDYQVAVRSILDSQTFESNKVPLIVSNIPALHKTKRVSLEFEGLHNTHYLAESMGGVIRDEIVTNPYAISVSVPNGYRTTEGTTVTDLARLNWNGNDFSATLVKAVYYNYSGQPYELTYTVNGSFDTLGLNLLSAFASWSATAIQPEDPVCLITEERSSQLSIIAIPYASGTTYEINQINVGNHVQAAASRDTHLQTFCPYEWPPWGGSSSTYKSSNFTETARITITFSD